MFREKLALNDIKNIELEILEYWKSNNIEEKWYSLQSSNGNTLITYDGPPTANGHPGLHHLISKSYKDSLRRFFRMRGLPVSDFVVFDTHGLPVELAVEKKFNTKRNILTENSEIELFNQRCREHVDENILEFEKTFKRFGSWHRYRVATYSNEYISSVWSSFHHLFKKGLVYQSYKVFYFCTSCRTPLSSHEVSQGYKLVDDPSLYFLVKSNRFNADYIIWTTTPWSIVGNRAIAVKTDGEYLLLVVDGKRYICALNMIDSLFEKGSYTILKKYRGSELVGDTYDTPVDVNVYSSGDLISDDEVDINVGSGIVHIAPPFGEYDWSLHLKYKLGFKLPLNDDGSFNIEHPLLNGIKFHEANNKIIQLLSKEKRLFRNLTENHSYPFCWRCDERLIQFPTNAWLIRATEIRETLINVNKSVDWRPDTIGEGRFGKWLEKNVDWVVSRNRYWGTPIPIWICKNKHTRCISSHDELNLVNGKIIDNIHRPYVDRVVFACSDCGEKMERVSGIMDVWYDSAALPFASYGEEDMGNLSKYYPSHFVAEGIDQTRGWFYTLLLLGVLLGDYKAYSSVIVIGFLLDDKGRKMSKRLKNIVEPNILFEKYGADITRCFLLSQKRQWTNRNISEKKFVDVYGRLISPYFNSALFLSIYVRSYDWRYEDYSYLKVEHHAYKSSEDFTDMWLLSLRELAVKRVIEHCNNLRLAEALEEIERFLVQLSTVYIRTNRERFWKEDSRAISILKDTLTKISILSAPLLPFFTEYIYLNHLKISQSDDLESIHLAKYPDVDHSLLREELLEQMNMLQRVISNVRMLRNKNNIPLKQPLNCLMVSESLFDQLKQSNLLQLIIKELNLSVVKPLLQKEIEKNTLYTFKPNYKTISADYSKKTKSVAKYIEESLSKEIYDQIRDGGELKINLDKDSAVNICTRHILLRKELIREKERYFIDEENNMYCIETELTRDLVYEGALRYFMHAVQTERKDSGFHIKDRIDMSILCDSKAFIEFLNNKRTHISEEALCKEILIARSDHHIDDEANHYREFNYRDISMRFNIKRHNS